MKITKCEIQKNNQEKVNIYIEDKYSFSISLNTFLEYGLKANTEISEEEIEKIKQKDSPQLAFIKLVDYMSYGPRTESEIRKKLKEKQFDDNAIDYAINKANKYGYIDDDKYLIQYIQQKAIPNRWGEQKIIANLYPKGIDINKIKKAIEMYYPQDEKIDNAITLAEKKLKNLSSKEPSVQKQKLYSFLASRGYNYTIIKEVINKVMNNTDDEYYE